MPPLVTLACSWAALGQLAVGYTTVSAVSAGTTGTAGTGGHMHTHEGGCSPQKACDFLVTVHQQCIDSHVRPPVRVVPPCKPIELICTPEDNCLIDSAILGDNVSTNGLERGLTMENVVIQNSIGYANVLLSIGPFSSGFKGTNITFRNTPTSIATASGGGCVINNYGSFSCTDCVFSNCSNIGTGGGVNTGAEGQLVLVNPTFTDCLAGWIPAVPVHKPGFGDGCYCERPDAANCVGCTCKKGSAGHEPGFYCDSTHTGGEPEARSGLGDGSASLHGHVKFYSDPGCTAALFNVTDNVPMPDFATFSWGSRGHSVLSATLFSGEVPQVTTYRDKAMINKAKFTTPAPAFSVVLAGAPKKCNALVDGTLDVIFGFPNRYAKSFSFEYE